MVEKYHATLCDYINDIRNWKLSVKSCDSLLEAFGKFKQNKNYENIKIKLITKKLNVLIKRSYEYTIKLANYDIELTDDEISFSEDAILDLQNYLEI